MKKIIIILLLSIQGICFGQTTIKNITWPIFMAHQNLKWDNISDNYYNGIILGNGLLGTNIYKETDSAIRFDIGRSDVVDNRQQLFPDVSKLYTKSRLPIGYFSLHTEGKITGAIMELDIYNAEAKGKIFTSLGEINIYAYVVANQNVIYIKVNALGNERASNWKWKPARSISPRYMHSYPKDKPLNFPDNPPGKIINENGYVLFNQPLLNNGGYTTAYKRIDSNNNSKLLISVGFDSGKNNNENKEAINYIHEFERQNEAANNAQHRDWWHNFYQQSFISLPDKRMENFYWIQLYKLASATRSNKPMLDLMGPWTNSTPWPAIWWNLNTQLAYSPIFTANHLELGQSLFKSLNDNKQNLIKNVPEKWRNDAAAIGRSSSYDLVSPFTEKDINEGIFEPANLTWVLYYYYQYYIYSKDETTLRTKIYPLLKKSTNFLIHLLNQDKEGVYHLPLSFSPEYKSAEDANYTLATLNWALSALIKINIEQQLKDKDAEKWEHILKNLTSYPVGDTGYLIGKGVPLIDSHRHYSHMLMIYPYNMINWQKPENHDVIEKTLTHWLSLKGALQGYTYTGAAAMYASMGNGNKSYELLNDLFNKYIQPNTLYRESGPVIETPLAAATSIQEMLIQSREGIIRIFPAIPAQWTNLSFKQLRTEGAFLVSADMQNSITTYIEINSLKGGTCSIICDIKKIKISSNKRNEVDYVFNRYGEKLKIDIKNMKPHEIIKITNDGAVENNQPVQYTQYKDWSWGLNKK